MVRDAWTDSPRMSPVVQVLGMPGLLTPHSDPIVRLRWVEYLAPGRYLTSALRQNRIAALGLTQ